MPWLFFLSFFFFFFPFFFPPKKVLTSYHHTAGTSPAKVCCLQIRHQAGDPFAKSVGCFGFRLRVDKTCWNYYCFIVCRVVIARTSKKHKRSGCLLSQELTQKGSSPEKRVHALQFLSVLATRARGKKGWRDKPFCAMDWAKAPCVQIGARLGQTWFVPNHIFHRFAADVSVVNLVTDNWIPLHWDHWKASH